jgi:hypothetical protein
VKKEPAVRAVPATRATTGRWNTICPAAAALALINFTEEKPGDTAGGTIAFEVEDLDRLMTDLKGKGVTFKSDVIHSPVCRMAVCLDSEGNLLVGKRRQSHYESADNRTR